MKKINNMILVSGSGRNSGKTTLCCALIAHLSKTGKVTAVKVAPHFHQTGKKQMLVEQGEGFRIYIENDPATEKDTSRMLRAGAQTVYFVQCSDGELDSALTHLMPLLVHKEMIICESGSLGLFYKPLLHVLVEGPAPDREKMSYLMNKNRADIIVTGDVDRLPVRELTDMADKTFTEKIQLC